MIDSVNKTNTEQNVQDKFVGLYIEIFIKVKYLGRDIKME